MNIVFAVAAGGALGAVARHLLVSRIAHWAGTGFPWGVLSANILGSIVMGALVEAMALAWSPSPELRAFLTVGLLGGFTTFSSFALDVGVLHGRGELGLAALYVLASVALSILGLFGGMAAVRHLVG
ncbi:MAG: fluoride efflux transporter CrcB [Alphaproteobacteria bacterium]